MAFDLNKKGDEKKKFDLSKSEGSASKFDLTKEKTSSSSDDRGKKKPALWIFAFLGLLALAFGVWYFTTHSNSHNIAKESAAQTASPGNNQVAVPSRSDTSSLTASSVANPQENMSTPARPNSTEGTNNSSTPETSNNSSGGNNSTSSNHDNSSTNSRPNSTGTSVASSTLNNKIPASFGYASATLNSVDEKIVSDIISYLSKRPNAKLIVNGYASSDGHLSVNQSISLQRANSFKNYLIGKGISSDKIVAVGKGIENPVASNDTDEGRIKNRRVEIVVQ